jgi:WD40 repeat protein
MIFFFALSTIVSAGEEDGNFMRGIAQQDDFIAVGSSMGNILLFGLSGRGGDISMRQNIAASKSPISALSSSSKYLFSGTDNGDLIFLDSNCAFAEAHKFPGNGTCVTSTAAFEDKVVAGYSSGHIRIFRVDIFELAVEITAHARCVMGLAAASDKSSFASCGEDQCINVWSLPCFSSQSSNEVDLLFTEKIDNQLCTGIAYLPSNRIAVASYDTDSAIIFTQD